MPDTILAQFSKVKFVQGSNFAKFRDFFLAKYLGGFIVPADTFDNVTGNFPIGFTMWNLGEPEKIDEIVCDIIERYGKKVGKKHFFGELLQSINKWIKLYDNGSSEHLAYMGNPAPDFQHNNQMYLSLQKGIEHFNFWAFTKNNIFKGAIYFAVRQVIEASWLNDRDQFLFPNEGWEKDSEFQHDCLAYMLFHGQNRISANDSKNYWIPFTEDDVNARDNFKSNFMSDFIKGKIRSEAESDLFNAEEPKNVKPKPQLLTFSPEAQAVFEAGKAIWAYYHATIYSLPILGGQKWTVNASLYDIREYFQGRNEKGKMNNRSEDEVYNDLITTLREKLKALAKKIEPKVYEYGFLKA